MHEIYKKIRNHSDFSDLVQLRNKISWGLTAIIIFCYFTFITIIAFAPNIFSQKIFSDSVITLGIIIGLSIILLSIFLTGVYVYIANKKFDEMIEKVINKATEN